MFIAHDIELGCLISIDEALDGGSGSYICPVCGKETDTIVVWGKAY